MRLRTRFGVTTLFFLLQTLAVNPAVARAQNTATISGTITDPSGAAVAGATITGATSHHLNYFSAPSLL